MANINSMKSLFLIICVLLNASFAECIKARSTSTAATCNTKSSAAINGFKNSISSGLAAGCAKTLLAPFDTIKTIQQQAS